MKEHFKKSVLTLMTVIAVAANSGLITQAQTINDETEAAYGWTETDIQSPELGRAYEPTWVLTDDKDVSVAKGTINMKSYVMTLLNDTKLCKATTSHSSYFYGYVRARFESIFGVVISGSDSDRVKSYYGATAETPDNETTVGWNGVAHTYCNSL